MRGKKGEIFGGGGKWKKIWEKEEWGIGEYI